MKHALTVFLVACSHPTPPQDVHTAPARPVDAEMFAAAENMRIAADYQCKCVGRDDCASDVLPPLESDATFQYEHVPDALIGGRTDDALDSCWSQVLAWENERGAGCLHPPGEVVAPATPRPTCGPAPRIERATVEPWWTRDNPCAAGEHLRTIPNPTDPETLFGAYCLTTAGAREAIGSRATTFFLNGSVESDRTKTTDTEWYPHGTKLARRERAGELTYYYVNGAVSDRAEHGVYTGFREDGSKLYVATDLQTDIRWFGPDGQPLDHAPDHDGTN